MRHGSITALLAAALFAAASVGSSQYVTGGSKEAKVDPKDFAIMPWGITDGDQAVYDQIRECGFNMAGFVPAGKLDLAAKAGLKAIVHDPSISVNNDILGLPDDEITSRVNAICERTVKHPATFGYYLRDEPDASIFPHLARWSKAFRTAAPDMWAYINLFPNYGPVGDYRQHIDSFVQQCQPRILSYDHYALMIDGTLRGGYFQNLEDMRAASLKHSIPFWNIVLSNAHFQYAEPSLGGFCFQAYTTLAYGGRGISYFTYFAPAIGNYRLAPIDQFGNKTPTWDMLRNVNLQLLQLAPTYTKLKSVNVFHHPEVPTSCSAIASSKFIKELEGGTFVVGEFEDPEKQPYVLIVNKDLHKSCAFSVKFNQEGAIQMVNSYSGKHQDWAGEDNWLAPGRGMLMTVAKKR